MTIKNGGCPNCGSKDFYVMGDAENRDSHVLLQGAKKLDDGTYKADGNKAIFVTPFICKECSCIRLFRAT
ncbi:MAG: hypothetical protein ACQEXE_10480 [Bacillota bacterium]